MAFTSITVTHQYATDLSGTVIFQLSGTMTNADASYLAGETITATVTAGALSQALPANNDADTVPASPFTTLWAVTVYLTNDTGERRETYYVTVPSDALAGTVDLYDLIPNTPQVS